MDKIITSFTNVVANWKHVKNACRTTVGKEESDVNATSKFRTNLIISEHSPIRKINFSWKWKDIPSWVSVHFSRHKWECFITTQRTDRTGIDRTEAGQGAPVTFEGEMNAQHAIDTARKRLCICSSKETRELTLNLKKEMREIPELVEVSDAMVPNCVYRLGCPETFTKCGYFDMFLLQCKQSGINMFDIEERYKAYNDMVYQKKLRKIPPTKYE